MYDSICMDNEHPQNVEVSYLSIQISLLLILLFVEFEEGLCCRCQLFLLPIFSHSDFTL